MKQAGSNEPFGVYAIAFLLALLIHAGLLLGRFGSSSAVVSPEVTVQTGAPGVEVELVAALPSEEPSPELTVEETPAPPEELALPIPQPIEIPPEPVLPEPTPAPEPPPPAEFPLPRATPPSKPPSLPAPAPAAPRRETPSRVTSRTAATPSGDGSSPTAGRDATSASAATGINAQPKPYPRNPRPPYPREARQQKQEGVVYLRVKIDARGDIVTAEISRSSGHPLLDESALRTVSRGWKFQPATLRGAAVPTEVTIPIRFSLQDL